MGTFRLAWRNIWRNRRRTTVTVAAMTLALWVTILYSSMVAGYIANLEKDALDFELGAVQVFAQGYQDRPSVHSDIDDAAATVRRLQDAGLVAAPRLLGSALVAAGEASAGVLLRGIDVAADAKVLEVGNQVKDGQWLDPAHPDGVVVGVKLARTLGVKPGDELVLLSQATDGSLANQLANVRGVLRSVSEGTDRAGLYMTQDAFRSFLVFEGGAHQIIVGRSEALLLTEIEAKVAAAAPGRDVMTWRKLVPTLATMMDSVSGLMAFMFFIVNVAIGIVLLNAMLMAVFERIREFGVLKALGGGPGLVLRLIYAEGLLQVAVAVLLGTGLAAPALWYLSAYGINMESMAGVSAMGVAMSARWTAVVTPQSFISPIIMMAAVVLSAMTYPALKAALIAPVTAMRHT